MGLKIGNMSARHIWDHRPVQHDQHFSSSSTDSYVQSSRPHWLTRLPLLGKALPFLALTGCGSPEVKVGAGVAAFAGVAGLYYFLSRSINNRRIAALPSPVQIMKYGIPRIKFPRKLDTPEKVRSHYLNKGLDESTARRAAYAWFFQTRIYSRTIGDLNQYDLQRRDLYGIADDFSAGYSSDNELQEKMEGVGYSRYLGLMFNAFDRGISAVPELVNIFLAMNIVQYHMDVGTYNSGYAGLRYILSKYGGRSSEKLLIREMDVRSMLEVESSFHANDNRIVQGLTHLLCGGMALDAYEARQYGELKLAFAHIWSARSLFDDPRISENERFRNSIRTVVEKYPEDLIKRALSLWKASYPELSHPKEPWSPSMCSQTQEMLRNFAVKPA